MSVLTFQKTLFFFLLISFASFSQKKAIKNFTVTTKQISISTDGLDDFVLKNSETNFVEVFLYAENPNKQHIIVEEKSTETEIKFKIPVFKNEEEIFRKYITKRLKRATATIKVPNNTNVSIFGRNINIASKSYNGNLRIFIENGIVKLDTIQQNLELKVYAGNIIGTLKKTSLKAVSKSGKIKIDGISHQKEYEEKETLTAKEIDITTIKGNIFLTHQ
ncbi:hypothetical protein SHK09_02815 [Polaribacter sp. PL03]|uniref:hypothetical protein n=1 Tax=Polaribacter sp. PL03 TaxID=3088353 RepID=UPI0029D12362|nr:hypothetical protein [Polaribacter sp. PL03]MDX6745713.1 hypothetical protein [Polaribacter sp. PL03]